MKSLDAFVQQLPEEETLGELCVDVSAFVGEAEGSEIFRFVEPDIAQIYQIPIDALRLRKSYPDWPENLRQNVVMLALAHREPPTEEIPKGLLYAQIAEKNKALFTYLSAAFNARFPYLMGSKETEEEEKKTGESGDPNSSSA